MLRSIQRIESFWVWNCKFIVIIRYFIKIIASLIVAMYQQNMVGSTLEKQWCLTK
jgi:hypothetical protein